MYNYTIKILKVMIECKNKLWERDRNNFFQNLFRPTLACLACRISFEILFAGPIWQVRLTRIKKMLVTSAF